MGNVYNCKASRSNIYTISLSLMEQITNHTIINVDIISIYFKYIFFKLIFECPLITGAKSFPN